MAIPDSNKSSFSCAASVQSELFPSMEEFCYLPALSARASAFLLNYKTELCKNWEKGSCEFGDRCAFAHGREELRQPSLKSDKYKTRKCKQFHKLGYCMYGVRCQFIHTIETRRSEQPTAPSSRKGSFDNSPERRRLPIFREMTKREDA